MNTSNAFRRIAPVIAASIVAGGVAYFAVDHHSSSTASAGVTPAAYGAPPNGHGGFGGAGVAGEQRIQGTVTAKTAGTVTVKSTSGTATYVVNVTSEIVRNGQRATLAAIKVGDAVFVHVFPSSSGQILVERLFAGSSATSGPVGPPST